MPHPGRDSTHCRCDVWPIAVIPRRGPLSSPVATPSLPPRDSDRTNDDAAPRNRGGVDDCLVPAEAAQNMMPKVTGMKLVLLPEVCTL